MGPSRWEKVLIFLVWIMAYVTLEEFLCDLPQSVPCTTRYVKKTASVGDGQSLFWLDMQAINQYIHDVGGPGIQSDQIRIEYNQWSFMNDFLGMSSSAVPRFGLTIKLEKGTTYALANLKIYHEIGHWAYNTQPWLQRLQSLWWRRALSFWILPMISIWFCLPLILRQCRSYRKPAWLGWIQWLALTLLITFGAFRIFDPEEIVVDKNAHEVWSAGIRPCLTRGYETSDGYPYFRDKRGDLTLGDIPNEPKQPLALYIGQNYWATIAFRLGEDYLAWCLLWMTGYLVTVVGWPRQIWHERATVTALGTSLILITLFFHKNIWLLGWTLESWIVPVTTLVHRPEEKAIFFPSPPKPTPTATPSILPVDRYDLRIVRTYPSPDRRICRVYFVFLNLTSQPARLALKIAHDPPTTKVTRNHTFALKNGTYQMQTLCAGEQTATSFIEFRLEREVSLKITYQTPEKINSFDYSLGTR